MLRVFGQAVAFLDRLRLGLEGHGEIYREYDSLNDATQLHVNNESVGHGDRTRITLSIDVVNGSNFIRLVAREAGPETGFTIHSDGYAELGSGELRTQNFALNGWLETALNGETVGPLSGSFNNYDPPNDARRVRFNTNGLTTLTGLTGASAGRLRDLVNVGTGTMVLVNNSGSSSAGNRFTCPGGVDCVVPAGCTVRLWQDPTISGWRVLADQVAWRIPEGFSLLFEASSGAAGIAAFADKGGTQLIFQNGFGSFYYQNGILTVPGTIDTNTALLGATTLRSSVFELSTSTPANLTASQNNWTPTGGSAVRTIRLTANSGLSITGLSISQTAGRKVRLLNIGSNAITLAHESGSSSAANRFVCPGLTNLSLLAGAGVELWYDGTSSRWRTCR